jgi:hypothetical protein
LCFQEEDATLLRLVAESGARHWKEKARHLSGRVAKQCRERWHNHLAPHVNKVSRSGASCDRLKYYENSMFDMCPLLMLTGSQVRRRLKQALVLESGKWVI